MRKLALNDEILLNIDKPARYIGGEINAVTKDPEKVDIRFAMCFPDVYEIGMSHLGIQILYDMFNKRPDVWCQRVYSPWPDLDRILREKQHEFGTDLYLISDEPYRELAYDGVEVPYLTEYYANTVVCYSWSKSLSLPGERIGYLVIPGELSDYELVYAAAGIATRVSGFVNAPSLMQRAVARCLNAQTDIAAYNRNREALYQGLKSCGFACIKPQGAFYLFVKTPTEDEKEFVERAKKYHILVVPGSSFACPGYVRIAYCVSYETILRSLPYFKQLAEEYGLIGE